MFGAAARAVNILDPQKEAPAIGLCKIMRAHRRKGMAQMQSAVGTGRKTRRTHALRR